MSSNFTCENNLFEIIRKNNNYTIKFDPKNCDKTLARKITEIFRSENGIESDDYIEHEVNHDEIVNRIVFSFPPLPLIFLFFVSPSTTTLS